MTTTIYGLIDPRTGLLRYIGKTSQSLTIRLKNHCTDGHRKYDHRANWIRSLAAAGFRPQIVEIETCAGDGCQEEIYHIALARNDGVKLVNQSLGGEGVSGFKQSPAAVEKRAAKRRGKPLPRHVMIAGVEAARIANIGRKHSAEFCKRLSEAKKGKPSPLRGIQQDPEFVKRRIAARMAHPQHREIAIKFAAAGLKARKESGWQMSPEHKAAFMAGSMTREARAKHGLAMRGKKQDADFVKRRTRAVNEHYGDIPERRSAVEYFRTLRSQMGISQTDFASLTGVKQSYISGIESGCKLPSIAMIESMKSNLHQHSIAA